MQRILERGQIEAFAEAAIPRIRLPDPNTLFSRRAQRLRELSESGPGRGQAIGPYLRLMAALAEAQADALHAPIAIYEPSPPDAAQLEQARLHRMPPLHASGWRRDAPWLSTLAQICDSIAPLPGFPRSVRDVCARLVNAQVDQLDSQADALLAARTAEIDPATAPLLMAALQVYWLELASRFSVEEVGELDVPGACPVCGTLPVASIVRVDNGAQGYRYLHCALCATEWHMVRIKCTHCQSTKNIVYHSIGGGSEAIRAESCDECRTYLKILYQEKDPNVEPVADDLASVALDLLLSDAGYRRVSSNPLLWQSA